MTPILIVGSCALNHHEYTRPPQDIDWIADLDTASEALKQIDCKSIYPINGGKTLFGRNQFGIYEVELAWPGNLAQELLTYCCSLDAKSWKVGCWVTASLNVLYTLKMSHRYLKDSPHFHKTMADIQLMRKLGASIPADLEDWYKRRQAATYSYKLPNLSQSKEDFFQDVYQYDHDSLHHAVAIGHNPAYQKFAEPGQEVRCSKALWDEVSYVTKIRAAVEEASVLALERCLIPHPGKKTENQAFKFALTKVCTSITSGWFREFCWENHASILDAYAQYKVRGGLLKLLQDGIDSGAVKRA